jgi:hypothetical protein
MPRTAGTGVTGRLDAIVYRAGTSAPFYVSEHESSFARGDDISSCLDNLSGQVRQDVSDGVYPPPEKHIIRTFVTTVEAPLDLRDGRRAQPFICRVDEVAGHRGRRSFEAQCPTNYLRESGRTMHDAMKGLAEVISARYEGESVTDLMRELPKRPIMTSFILSGRPDGRWAQAAVQRKDGRYEAFALAAPVSVQGRSPLEALERLESRLAGRGLEKAVSSRGEPAFCTMDVPLHLRENISIRRFFVAVSRYRGRGSPFYAACAPQAGISVRAPTFDGALDGARDAIALEFREKSGGDMKRMLREMPMLTAAKIA